jgi:spermidine synthase
MPHPARPLRWIFALSGFAGLISEIAWSRALGQTLGTALAALTFVLVFFLGGLGLGAALAARGAGRIRRPLRCYAILEGGVALWAFLSPSLAALTGRLLERHGAPLAGLAGIDALHAALAAALLLPPTLAMGATFPFVVRETARHGVPAAGAVATLYGANTLGAAAGAFTGAFLLLPQVGTRLTFVSSGLASLLAGAGALILDRRNRHIPPATVEPPAPGTGEPGTGEDAPAALRAGARVAALVSGLAGAVLQVGWIRVASLAFGSTIYAIGTTLGAYILGLGLGPFLARKWTGRPGGPPAVAPAALALAGGLSLAALPSLGALPRMGVALGGLLPDTAAGVLGLQFILMLAHVLPATVAQGAAFPALALLGAGGRPAHREAGLVFALSTWGSVAGFVLAGFSLLPRLGTRRSLAAAGLGLLLLALLLHGVVRPRAALAEPRRLRTALLAGALLAGLGLALLAGRTWRPEVVSGGGILYGAIYRAGAGAGPLAGAMRRRGEIVYEREDGSGLVTVRRSPAGTLSLQINGKTEASSGGDLPTQILSAHLPLLLHPAPREVLLIGLASGITLGSAATHPLERITVFEIAPAVVGAARAFADHNRGALDDPRLRLRLEDARAGLLAGGDRYDVISSQPSNPWVAGVANLFTVEFYRLARLRLRPGGLFCQWVQAYRLDPVDLRAVVAAFLEVFPEATLWEESAGGGDYFLIGGTGSIQADPAVLVSEARAAARVDLRRAGIDSPAALLARFVIGPRGLADFAAGARPHDDDLLALEWRAPLALYRADPRAAIAALNRHREEAAAILPASAPAGWSRALREERLRQEERLSILASLGDADLVALGDPFLAAATDALRRGHAAEAIPLLARAAAANPRSATIPLLQGAACHAAGLEQAAAVALRASLDLDPDLAPAWNLLGRIARNRGDRGTAERAFIEAVTRATDAGIRAAARNNLGTLRLESGALEEAERLFRQAIEDAPALPAARVNLAVTLKRRGDRAGAESACRQALRLDPLDTDARYNLAAILLEAGRPAEAAAEVRRLLEIDPDDVEAARLLRRAGGR